MIRVGEPHGLQLVDVSHQSQWVQRMSMLHATTG
jgi:hypothetical protein